MLGGCWDYNDESRTGICGLLRLVGVRWTLFLYLCKKTSLWNTWCSEGCSECYEQYKYRNLFWVCIGGLSGSLPRRGDTWAALWRQSVGFNKANNERVAGSGGIVCAKAPKWRTAWWESREFGRWLVMNEWYIMWLFSFCREGNWGSGSIYPESHSRVLPGLHYRDSDSVRNQNWAAHCNVQLKWELLLLACYKWRLKSLPRSSESDITYILTRSPGDVCVQWREKLWFMHRLTQCWSKELVSFCRSGMLDSEGQA